jgi:hypothetical protein
MPSFFVFLAAIFLVAAAIKIFGKQYEHALARIFLALLYLYAVINTDWSMSVESRIYFRVMTGMIAVVEITSYVAIRIYRRLNGNK